MAKRIAIIASGGGLETAYKTFNIALAGAAMDAEVAIFFTFEGLPIIHKQGPSMLRLKPENEPMAEGFARTNVPPIDQLITAAKESGIRLIGCQMTVDALGWKADDFIDGVEFAGAATFLDYAMDAQVTLNF